MVGAAALVMAVGATPASAGSHTPAPRPPVAFSHPADGVAFSGFCQPTHRRPCPEANVAWSGYILSPVPGRQFIAASGTWVQPRVTCPKANAWTLFWVGIDGNTTSFFGGPTVEQGGSSAQCIGGTPQYTAWWEMYPTNNVTPAFPISVGDHMSTGVVYSATADTYTVTVEDITTGETFVVVCSTNSAPTNPNTYTTSTTVGGVTTTTGPTAFTPVQNDASGQLCSVSTPCQNASAEWVVEAPGGNNGGLYPLAHFLPVTFNSAHATDNNGDAGSISDPAWQDTAADLVNSANTQQDEAKVKALKQQGRAFRDVWASGQLQ